MGFNISEFHSQISKRGGLARTNTFEVVITKPAGLQTDMSGEDLRFFCQSVAIPSLGLTTTDYIKQGYGKPEKRVTNVEFETFSAVFAVDSQYRVRQFFDNWISLAVNYDNRSYNREQGGKLPYEIEYRENIEGTIVVKVYGGHRNPANYIHTFEYAYPINVGSVQLAWADNDSYLALPVTFTFSGYIHSELPNPSTGSFVSRT